MSVNTVTIAGTYRKSIFLQVLTLTANVRMLDRVLLNYGRI